MTTGLTDAYAPPYLSELMTAVFVRAVNRSGAAADRRAILKPGAQLDLASSYAVPRTGRTESPTSLNYSRLCVELNHSGAAIGEMWGDLVRRHIVFELFMLNRGFPRFRRESVCDRHLDGVDSALKGGYPERQGNVLIPRVRKVSTCVSSYLSDLKLTVCARRHLKKTLEYMGFHQRRPSIDIQTSATGLFHSDD